MPSLLPFRKHSQSRNPGPQQIQGARISTLKGQPGMLATSLQVPPLPAHIPQGQQLRGQEAPADTVPHKRDWKFTAFLAEHGTPTTLASSRPGDSGTQVSRPIRTDHLPSVSSVPVTAQHFPHIARVRLSHKTTARTQGKASSLMVHLLNLQSPWLWPSRHTLL